jgi:LAO/AO transport system kinase
LDAAGYDVVLMETVGTGQSEVEVAARPTRPSFSRRPNQVTRSRRSRRVCSRSADIVVVNKGDRAGRATNGEPAAGDAGGIGAAVLSGGRPAPKRPQVLITTASTGDGVGELLTVLDARAPHRDGRVASDPARLARADAQVRAVLAERLQSRLARPDLAAGADALVNEVAEHRLDPYSAADALLALVGAPPAGDSR